MGTTRALLASLLSVLLVASCSGDPEPIYAEPSADPSSGPASSASDPSELPSEPGTPSGEPTSPAPTEEAGPPPLPAAAAAPTKAGAEAFVRHYFDVLNYVQGAADTGPLRRLATDGCDGCRGGADSLDELFDEGGRIADGAYVVSSVAGRSIFIETYPDRPLFELRVSGDIREGREVIDGEEPVVVPGYRFSYRMVLLRVSATWKVAQLEAATS